MDHAQRSDGVPNYLAWGFLALFLGLVLFGPATTWGRIDATRDAVFLVSDDDAALVVIRRYGETLVVAEVAGQQIQSFRFLDVTEDERGWQRQRLGNLGALRTCERDENNLTLECF